jgi:hypothetical protein
MFGVRRAPILDASPREAEPFTRFLILISSLIVAEALVPSTLVRGLM